ncbi:hypothetical protein [Corallococcus exiguus]|uniref:Uncharacterized protein n=1 Tax=Corallococcus exiguus TaxID=83462 RepID=A0A7X5BTB4_9BACT|nr:hypothetical protein [Corallococcus exiguus]NBC42824.1 hypothetical protein [Corallococcus exiguus]TNV66518.1 hypothetical protein FH620_05600 [Corallococcus exiguus]
MAIDEYISLAAKVFVDRMTDLHHLCPACVVPVEAWLSAYRLGTQPVPEPDYSMSGSCLECAREWYKDTGLGDLGAAVQKARGERWKIEQELGG